MTSFCQQLVLATNNPHKVIEIKAILRRQKIRCRVLSLNDFPSQRPVIENKRTIEGNAIKKASEIARRLHILALADDTGLFIEALKGAPGVISARFAGKKCTYDDNNNKVLRLMKAIPWSKRNAEFRCVAALANPDGKVVTVLGKIRGKIAFEQKGKNGFGYDPIFYVPRFKKTFAELSPRHKNMISHRSRAFSKVSKMIGKVVRLQERFFV